MAITTDKRDRLTIHPTKRPHTFFLKYKYVYFTSPSISYADDCENYRELAQELVNEINETGIKANLKTRYKRYSFLYITFRSRYDAAAFKLGWM